jgi:hypothetical protein
MAIVATIGGIGTLAGPTIAAQLETVKSYTDAW